MMALAGYSAGAVLAARGRRVVPRPADLALAFACAVAAAVCVPELGWMGGFGAALIGGMGIGAAAGSVAPEMAMEAADAEAEPVGRWRRFSRRMGNFQARLVLGAVYFLLVTPFALAHRLGADPLAAPAGEGTRWRPRPPRPQGIDAARGQG